jgi:S1-C subfamily serine protease
MGRLLAAILVFALASGSRAQGQTQSVSKHDRDGTFYGTSILADCDGLKSVYIPVNFASDPPGAEVFMDGVSIGATPKTLMFTGCDVGGKVLLRSQRTSVQLVFAKEGYIPLATKMELASVNEMNTGPVTYGYFALPQRDYSAKLDAIEEQEASQTDAVQRVMRDARGAMVMIVARDGGIGSGFLVRENGVVATSDITGVKGWSGATIILPNGRPIQTFGTCWNVGGGPGGVNVLKVSGSGFKFLPLNNAFKSGIDVIALGTSGIETSAAVVKQGRVTGAFDTKLAHDKNSAEWLETDAAITMGNTGGPLLDMQGEVVGLSIMKDLRPGQSDDSVALPASELDAIVKSCQVPWTSAHSHHF